MVVTIVVVATAADNIALKALRGQEVQPVLGGQLLLLRPGSQAWNIVGALILRIGSWGPLYYNYNKEPPK